MQDSASLGVELAGHDDIKWRAKVTVEKFSDEDIIAAGFDPSACERDALVAAGVMPYEVEEREGNLLMYGGVSCLWQCLLGNGTATADQALTFFNNARAAVGVGDSTTAAAATQTDLQAATNKLRKAMDATYPQHTDATTAGAATVTFRSTYATGDANWVWAEWGIFNSVTAATGRMLNRKVEALGTKASGAWALTVTLTLS